LNLAESTIQFALTQVGVEEEPRGSNSSPIIDGYLRYVNLPPGSAWCAAFVSFSVNQGAFATGIDSTLKPSGGALALYFKNHDLVLAHPVPNCIGIIDHGHGLGHAFFITDVQDSTVKTCEGNTDPAGGREGYEVAQRWRPTASITYFLRIA
jgi:hypothetical protein